MGVPALAQVNTVRDRPVLSWHFIGRWVADKFLRRKRLKVLEQVLQDFPQYVVPGEIYG